MNNISEKKIGLSKIADDYTHKEAVYRENSLTVVVKVDEISISDKGVGFYLSLLPGHCEFLSSGKKFTE